MVKQSIAEIESSISRTQSLLDGIEREANRKSMGQSGPL